MADKSSAWRPGPTVCRCCLAEGCYKDISTEYFWMGKREVYADMLADTLSLSIGYSKTGGPNSNSRLICEPCISRLRDATDFKRQVQECEKTFMQYLDPGSSSVMSLMDSDDIQMETIEKDVKIEQVKVEKKYSDDEFDSRDFGDDDDDDDDMDQPLTTFASKEPKKETINLLDLLESPKKKTTKPKLVAKKKIIIKKDVKVKPTTSKAVPKSDDKKRKEQSPMYYERKNACAIVEYATAYPFRLPESEPMCIYCCEKYIDPEAFRSHMEEEHPILCAERTVAKTLFYQHSEGYIKVDCTNLKCRICDVKFDTLQAIASHLKVEHRRNIDLDHPLGLLPFMMTKDRLWCGVCDRKFVLLRSLSKHIVTHYVQFTCETCGKSYATNTSLQSHIKFSCGRTKNTKPFCRTCRREFDTSDEKILHYKDSIICRMYVCHECGERFAYDKDKTAHLSSVHNIHKQNKCPECGEVFKRPIQLSNHFKVTHTTDYISCPSCDKRFTNEYRLKKHQLVHTGEKPFKCKICTKSFPRKSTLIQHMWIHSDVKRWTCRICDKPFNQKVCWKTHMKSHHGITCPDNENLTE